MRQIVFETALAAALLLSLACPVAAAPAPTPMEELEGWGACAAVLGLYEDLVEGGYGSAADRALLDRGLAAEPRIKARFVDLADALTATNPAADALRERIMDKLRPRMAPYMDNKAGLLTEFRPDLEACIDRSAAPPAPAEPS